MKTGMDKIMVIPFSSDGNQLFITCYQIIAGDTSLQKQPLTGLEFVQSAVEESLLKCDGRCKVFNNIAYYFIHEQQTNIFVEAYQGKIYTSVKIPFQKILQFFEQQSSKKIDTYSVNNKKYFISEQFSAVLKTKQYNYWDQWLTGRIHHAFFLPYIKQGNEIYFYLRENTSGRYIKDVRIQFDLARLDIDGSTYYNDIAWTKLKNKFNKDDRYRWSFLLSKKIPTEGPFYIDYEGDRLYLVQMRHSFQKTDMEPFAVKEFFNGIQGEGALYIKNTGYITLVAQKISPSLLPLLKMFCTNQQILRASGISVIEKKDQADSEQTRDILSCKQRGYIQLILEPQKDILEKIIWYDLCNQNKLESLGIIDKAQFEVAKEKNCFIKVTSDQCDKLLQIGFKLVPLSKIIKAIQNKKDDCNTVTIKFMVKTHNAQGVCLGKYFHSQKIIGEFLVTNLQQLINQNFDLFKFKNRQPEEQVYVPAQEVISEQPKNNILSRKNIVLLIGTIISIILISYGCWKYKALKNIPWRY
jgi:hypothetical protein